ncbi:MAG TPA: hypothetical protein VGB59_02330 [Allosphingosinicella sp.]|jgi:hypothetical protein
MANQNNDGLSGQGLQQSQSGGDSGEFGGNREQAQQQGQQGGGASAADMDQAGGSSGSGGYGNMQNQQNHQGQQSQGQSDFGGGSEGQSRGERFDEAQGGGRGADSSGREAGSQSRLEAEADEFLQDQQAHQDRGQSDIEFNSEQP